MELSEPGRISGKVEPRYSGVAKDLPLCLSQGLVPKKTSAAGHTSFVGFGARLSHWNGTGVFHAHVPHGVRPHWYVYTCVALLCTNQLAMPLKSTLSRQKSCYVCTSTVEPPNKGHFGANRFVPCREVVPISEVPLYIASPPKFPATY